MTVQALKSKFLIIQLFTSVVLLAVNLQCFLPTVYILCARISNIGKIVMMAIITCTKWDGMDSFKVTPLAGNFVLLSLTETILMCDFLFFFFFHCSQCKGFIEMVPRANKEVQECKDQWHVNFLEKWPWILRHYSSLQTRPHVRLFYFYQKYYFLVKHENAGLLMFL